MDDLWGESKTSFPFTQWKEFLDKYIHLPPGVTARKVPFKKHAWVYSADIAVANKYAIFGYFNVLRYHMERPAEVCKIMMDTVTNERTFWNAFYWVHRVQHENGDYGWNISPRVKQNRIDTEKFIIRPRCSHMLCDYGINPEWYWMYRDFFQWLWMFDRSHRLWTDNYGANWSRMITSAWNVQDGPTEGNFDLDMNMMATNLLRRRDKLTYTDLRRVIRHGVII
jgi:hypothetical protein